MISYYARCLLSISNKVSNDVIPMSTLFKADLSAFQFDDDDDDDDDFDDNNDNEESKSTNIVHFCLATRRLLLFALLIFASTMNRVFL